MNKVWSWSPPWSTSTPWSPPWSHPWSPPRSPPWNPPWILEFLLELLLIFPLEVILEVLLEVLIEVLIEGWSWWKKKYIYGNVSMLLKVTSMGQDWRHEERHRESHIHHNGFVAALELSAPLLFSSDKMSVGLLMASFSFWRISILWILSIMLIFSFNLCYYHQWLQSKIIYNSH